MTLGLVLGLVFTLAWVPLYVFRTESLSLALPTYSRKERLWAWLSRTILTLHSSLACVAMTLVPAVPPWRAVVSVAMLAGAIAFWFWARVRIGPLRTRRMPDEPPLQLRRDGAFGIVRHPLYFAYLVAAAAPLCVATRSFLVVTWLLCVISLAVRADQEERRLHAQLGPRYERYCGEVKRLVPYVW